MPSDLTGVSIFERGKEAFVFHPGPIFAQVLLADEINRASPKTQSALLEAMSERQVSIDGQTHPLPRPFMVIATQNPQNNTQFQTPTKLPEPSHPTPTDQPTDMMALVNANRQRRQAEEQTAQAATAKDRGTPNEDQRDAVIKKNLAQEGSNGIFQIREIGLHTAQFSFKGWKTNYNNARLEIFDVESRPGESIQLAVVRKMIMIIRKEYSGDFEWESQRLGRSITKSARIEDTADLESFLMREMFQNYGFR